MDIYDDSSSDEEFIPTKLKYVEKHDYENCIFCNLKSGKYINLKNGAWEMIFKLIKKYEMRGDVSIINSIIMLYERQVRLPAFKILTSGSGIGKVPYPKLTAEMIVNHAKKFSVNSVILDKFQKMCAYTEYLEDNLLTGTSSNGKKMANVAAARNYLECVKVMFKMAESFQKKKKGE